MNRYFVLFLCMALMLLQLMPVTADANEPLEFGSEISMPANIDFEIHDTCWEHDWFGQYHAREDGWFVVLHLVANLHGGDKQGFDRVYVDIYNSEGVFQKELSLNNTHSDIVACITQTAVEIYLQNCYLSYNLETETVTCHYTPANYVQNTDLHNLLWQSELQIGEWTYRSKGLPNMRHTLTREKDGNLETILKLKGSSLSFPNVIPYICCSAMTILVFLWIIKKKRRTKHD